MTGDFFQWTIEGRQACARRSSQTCRPQDPNGVPTQFSSQNVTDDKLRVTLPSQGMGVFQATRCLGLSGRLTEFSFFRQVSVITVTVSPRQGGWQDRPLSSPPPCFVVVDLFFS